MTELEAHKDCALRVVKRGKQYVFICCSCGGNPVVWVVNTEAGK